MILVDSSVWIGHLRSTDAELQVALSEGEVLMHPFIFGELACGNIRNRREILDLLLQLPVARTATDAEALAFIERRNLAGVGIGYVDVHILASTALTPDATLWTRDRRLSRAAVALGLGRN